MRQATGKIPLVREPPDEGATLVEFRCAHCGDPRGGALVWQDEQGLGIADADRRKRVRTLGAKVADPYLNPLPQGFGFSGTKTGSRRFWVAAGGHLRLQWPKCRCGRDSTLRVERLKKRIRLGEAGPFAVMI